MNSQWKDGWFEDICAEAEGFQGGSVVVADGKLIEALLDHAPVKISKSDVFTGSLEHIDGLRQVIKKRIEESEFKLKKDPNISKLLLAHQLRTYKGDYDFSHTAPDFFLGCKPRHPKPRCNHKKTIMMRGSVCIRRQYVISAAWQRKPKQWESTIWRTVFLH